MESRGIIHRSFHMQTCDCLSSRFGNPFLLSSSPFVADFFIVSNSSPRPVNDNMRCEVHFSPFRFPFHSQIRTLACRVPAWTAALASTWRDRTPSSALARADSKVRTVRRLTHAPSIRNARMRSAAKILRTANSFASAKRAGRATSVTSVSLFSIWERNRKVDAQKRLPQRVLKEVPYILAYNSKSLRWNFKNSSFL